jgi:predicted kinase
MPYLFMLIGLPASGKSTWRSNFLAIAEQFGRDVVVVSSDDLIEAHAATKQMTYAEVFGEASKMADKEARRCFAEAVASGRDIIVDRTNLTKATRAKFLSRLPETYRRHAVAFEVPPDALDERLGRRNATGKVIPPHIIEAMRASYEPPTNDEFDEIMTLGTGVAQLEEAI